MKTIQTPAIVTSISSKVDGSLRFGTVTPELTPEEKADFMELQNLNLEVTLKPTEEKTDIKEIKGEFDGKTPSQRLRNTIYVYWEQKGAKGEFDKFYLNQMNRLVDKIKENLN